MYRPVVIGATAQGNRFSDFFRNSIFMLGGGMNRHFQPKETMTDPTKIIAIMRVMLNELEQTLSTTPEQTDESAHTGELQTRIDRLDAVLKKRQAAERRRK